jgi:hypothetical protein
VAGLNLFANPVLFAGGTVLVMQSFDPAAGVRAFTCRRVKNDAAGHAREGDAFSEVCDSGNNLLSAALRPAPDAQIHSGQHMRTSYLTHSAGPLPLKKRLWTEDPSSGDRDSVKGTTR